MDPRIADYIRANRRRYTREAITKQLLEAGHDAGEIERTWVALDAPDADDVAGEGFWGRFALIVIGINLAVFLAVGLLTGMLTNLASGGVLLVILAIAMAIGALIAWAAVAATGPAKLSPRSALVIGAAIPALFAFLIGGTCYALVGSLGAAGQPVRNATIEIQFNGPIELDTTGEATCQANGPSPGDGISLYGWAFNPAGQQVDINVTTRPGSDELEAYVWIGTMIADKAEGRSISWGNEGPGTGEVELVLDDSDGAVRFTALRALQDDPGGPWGDPLAGEISWTCE